MSPFRDTEGSDVPGGLSWTVTVLTAIVLLFVYSPARFLASRHRERGRR